jgi:sulfur-carrier protein
MQVHIAIPSPLRSYTAGAAAVVVDTPRPAATLGEALTALEAAHPGIAFRMIDEQRQVRPHMQIFVNGGVQRNLAAPLPADAQVMIVAALSGG